MLKRGALKLLDKERLIVTGPLDKAVWNYSYLLSLLERSRFDMIVGLIGTNRYDDVLEIGYGSGIFLPELQCRSLRLHGVDIHQHAAAVHRKLAEVGVHASLHSASAESIPLDSGSIDLIVSISTLEYVADQRRAMCEMHRVLRPGGRVAILYPLPSRFSDIGLKLLTGESASQYGGGRSSLLPTLLERFSVVRRLRYPAWMPTALQVYEAVLLAPYA